MVNSIAYYLKQTSKKFPEKVAFSDGKNSITFKELDEQAQNLACAISKKLNGRINQPIAIYLPKGVECIISFMGVIYSGNYYTPIDVALPYTRVEKILLTLDPAMIVTKEAYCVDNLQKYEMLMIDSIERDVTMPNLVNDILSKIIDTDILYVMFTSGSTGNPKGVIVTHRAVIDFIEWVTETFEFDDTITFGNQAPFYFDNSILDIYSTIRNGSETVIIPEEMFLSGKKLCAYIEQKNINTIFWVPSALALVANSRALEQISLKKLNKIFFAGEVMPTKQLNIWRKALPEAMYVNLYGPTEIADICTYYILDREFSDEESIPIGYACKNIDILVLNSENKKVQVDEIGELCVRGTCLAHGYYGDAQKTNEHFVQNPLNEKYPEKIYRTGDLVKYNERGEIQYLGRKDSQIKHKGYRIELGEIEANAAAIDGMERCCVLYDDIKKRIVLFATPHTLEKKEIYAKLKASIPQYMLPSLIITEEEIPFNQSGKIDRLKLKEKLNIY